MSETTPLLTVPKAHHLRKFFKSFTYVLTVTAQLWIPSDISSVTPSNIPRHSAHGYLVTFLVSHLATYLDIVLIGYLVALLVSHLLHTKT